MTYVKVTKNPNMGWSNERKAKFSKSCLKARADGTWTKKSKEEIGYAISQGQKRSKIRAHMEQQKERERSQEEVVLHNDQNNIKKLQMTDKERILTLPSTTKVWNGIHKEMEAGSDKPDPAKVSELDMIRIINLFNKIEKELGVRPDLNKFVHLAIEAKLVSVYVTMKSDWKENINKLA